MKRVGVLVALSLLLLIIFPSYINPQYQGNRHYQVLEKGFKQEGIMGQDNIYFVFLNGLDCKSDGTRYGEMGFEEIRRAMARAGFTFSDHRFLLYSYTGGKVAGELWYPDKYSSVDTGQPLQLSVQNLELLIERFSLSHPEASFVLVGHSLGGRIALDFVSSTNEENKKRIKGVITLNAPLTGASFKVPGVFMEVLARVHYILNTPVVRQLIWEAKVLEENNYIRRETIKELQNSGVRIATFSTNQDMVVHAMGGCIVDQEGKPVTEGYIVNVNRLPIRHFFGHMQILEHSDISRYLVNFYLELILK